MRRVGWLVGLLGMVAGCGEIALTDAEIATVVSCQPHAVQACECPGGGVGSQSCTEDGSSWDVCSACDSTEASLITGTAVGDRGVRMNIVYPPKAFSEVGGPVINIKSAPYHAKGDGVTDDTAAFKAVMNFLRDELTSARAASMRVTRWSVYVPAGTYLVSDTLIHDGTMTPGFNGLILVGQDRRNTIIKLKNNSPGFSAGSNKPVLAWTRLEDGAGGKTWGNQLRNLTVDTGTGNPGAVGVLFLGANTSSIDNLTVRSGDGQGAVGLWFPTWSVQGHYSDITVSGFDYGIGCDIPTESNPNLEYISLTGQKKAGIRVGGSGPSIRKLHSTNSVPALAVEGTGAQVVVLDSRLSGTNGGSTAIRFNKTAAGSATLNAGWSGRARDSLGVSAVDNLKVTVQHAGEPAQTVVQETFDPGSATPNASGFQSAFEAGVTSGQQWTHGGTGGVGGGGRINAPAGQITSVVRRGSIAGFRSGTSITLTLDTLMRGTGVTANDIPFKAFIKDLPTLSGITGLDFQCNYVKNATANKFQVTANGAVLGTTDLPASIQANNTWWYRWTATWTRRGDDRYDLTLQLHDMGAHGTSAPKLVGSWQRAGFTAAIKSHLFVRNVEVNGYRSSIEVDTRPEVTGNVDEFNSHGTWSFLSTSPKRSMNLPIEEAMLVPWESNPNNWASPEDYSGTPAQRIQAALNSGKPAICFPRAYTIHDEAVVITVPATVRQMDFMGQQKHTFKNTFEVLASSQPLWIEHASGNAKVRMKQARPLNVRWSDLRLEVATPDSITVHLQNAYVNSVNTTTFCPPNARIYARSINHEDWSTYNFLVNGGLLWVMGFKTEACFESFVVRNGGLLEVLGGYQNMAGKSDVGRPMVLNDHSNVSFIGTTFMGRTYQQAIWENRNGTTYKFANTDFPRRWTYANYTVPLYTGYDAAAVPAQPRITVLAESFDVASKVSNATQFETVFLVDQVSGNTWGHVAATGTGGSGALQPPGGQNTSAVHRTPVPGFATRRSISMSTDTLISFKTASEPTYGITWWMYAKPSLSAGRGGLVLELAYIPPAGRSTQAPERFRLLANGVKIGAPEFTDDRWYRWDVTWTQATDQPERFDVGVDLHDLGATGTETPAPLGSFAQSGISQPDVARANQLYSGVQGRSRDSTGVMRLDNWWVGQ